MAASSETPRAHLNSLRRLAPVLLNRSLQKQLFVANSLLLKPLALPTPRLPVLVREELVHPHLRLRNFPARS